MTPWSAPKRVEPAFVSDERTGLEAWLDYHRATLLVKCADLDGEQLARRACPPSTLSLLGLVRHLAEVERNWFRVVLDGQEAPGIFYDEVNPDGDFDFVDPAGADDDLASYLGQVSAAREIAARFALDDVGRRQRRDQDVSLRWIYLHLIEEYARHNGHADLIRQAIDGAVGE